VNFHSLSSHILGQYLLGNDHFLPNNSNSPRINYPTIQHYINLQHHKINYKKYEDNFSWIHTLTELALSITSTCTDLSAHCFTIVSLRTIRISLCRESSVNGRNQMNRSVCLPLYKQESPTGFSSPTTVAQLV
jgi:hypothetical protein